MKKAFNCKVFGMGIVTGFFLLNGCVGAGVGGNLTNREWIAAGEWDKIENAARQLVERSSIDANAVLDRINRIDKISESGRFQIL